LCPSFLHVDLPMAIGMEQLHIVHRVRTASAAREWAALPSKRGAGPQRLGEILPAVLARLGGELVQSQSSGDMILSAPEPVVEGLDNAVSSRDAKP
jgi:hypothetical protein